MTVKYTKAKEKIIKEWCKNNFDFTIPVDLQEKNVWLEVDVLIDEFDDGQPEIYAVQSYLTDGNSVFSVIDEHLKLCDVAFPDEVESFLLLDDYKGFTGELSLEKDGGYSVVINELPGCHTQGETIEELNKNINDAITLYLEDKKCEIEKKDAMIIFSKHVLDILSNLSQQEQAHLVKSMKNTIDGIWEDLKDLKEMSK